MHARRIWYGFITALFFIAIEGAAFAQSSGEPNGTEDSNASSGGTSAPAYNGVVPGSGNPLPKVEELKTLDGVWVTWPGFVMKEDGGSRIFLQTTVSVDYAVEKGASLVVDKRTVKPTIGNARELFYAE